MNKEIVVGSTYKKELSSTYNMSIQLRLNGLSFAIFDPVTNSFVMLGNMDLDTPDYIYAKQEEFMLIEPIFKEHYKSIKIGIESSTFTMLPYDLYDEDKLIDLTEFVGIKPKEDVKILTDKIETISSVVLFPVPQFLYYFIHTQFSQATIIHTITPMIDCLLYKKESRNINNVVNIIFTSQGVTILASQNNRLKLCNEFRSQIATDLVYSILYTLDQLGMNNKQTKVSLSGDVDSNDERVKLLRRFVHNVTIAERPQFFNYNINITKNEHKYTTLYMMSLCE